MSGSQPRSVAWETEKQMELSSHSLLTSIQVYRFRSTLHPAPDLHDNIM